MSFIKTYQPLAYSQINLDSGERILISRAIIDTKILKLTFLSLPSGTIYTFDNRDLIKILSKIGATGEFVQSLADIFV